MSRRTPRDLVGGAPQETFTFRFDGREIPAATGQTVAAALWGAGVLAWRTTRGAGEPRGAFCGIGQCFDCLVTVDGTPNRRACLVPARPGGLVTSQEGTGHDDLAV
ncbi:(2Fe-2S)-binding protein [Streptomyces sp. NRRL F-5727]|uniref:(2Fe-2S)-binding protein n=1 Tax=Streptomyces sp. NRRL F-5727 TaxID=1463871 RepID=UPI0004CBFD34|nr:(2Fe-2S)-binding protein [Streptomyces sp. NRRL F-5727]